MTHSFCAVVLVLIVFGCAPIARNRSVPEKPGWVLTFHDEFDNDTLDTTKWSGRYTIIPSLRVIDNGVLHLRIDKWFPPFGPGGANGRISGIETRRVPNPFSQKYGWFEIRAKCFKGPGNASVFWLSPAESAPREVPGEANEFDIYEQQGNVPFGNNFTVHYAADSMQGSSARHVIFPFDLTADFHVYAFEWSATQIIWYVD